MIGDLSRAEQTDLIRLARRKAKQAIDVIKKSSADREV